MGIKIEDLNKNDKRSLNANLDKRSVNAKPGAQSSNNLTQVKPAPKSVQTSAPKTKAQPNTAPSDGPSTSKNAGKKHFAPSRELYQHKRTALRLVKYIGQIEESERTDKQRTSIKWATSILARDTSVDQQNCVKRQRSLEETSPTIQPVPKKSRPAMKSYSDMVKGHRRVAVIDRADKNGTITPDKWREVEAKLNTVFLDLLREYPDSDPRFYDGGWFQGHVKLIVCTDQHSVDLYKLAISRIGEAWPGAKLEVVNEEDIPKRPRARTLVPAEPSDPQTILEIIRRSNRSLNTDSWSVYKVEEAQAGKRWIFLTLNVECMEALRAASGCIGFGFTSIELRIFKKDSLAASKSSGATSVAEPPSALCEAGRTETPLEVLEPLEDELSLALSSLPFPDSDITLSDLEDADVTVLEAGEPVSSNAEGSPN